MTTTGSKNDTIAFSLTSKGMSFDSQSDKRYPKWVNRSTEVDKFQGVFLIWTIFNVKTTEYQHFCFIDWTRIRRFNNIKNETKRQEFVVSFEKKKKVREKYVNICSCLIKYSNLLPHNVCAFTFEFVNLWNEKIQYEIVKETTANINAKQAQPNDCSTFNRKFIY